MGTVITGFLDRGPLVGVGVVFGTEACVAPADGACWTPGATELPQAERARAAAAAAVNASGRVRMKQGRVADERKSDGGRL